MDISKIFLIFYKSLLLRNGLIAIYFFKAPSALRDLNLVLGLPVSSKTCPCSAWCSILSGLMRPFVANRFPSRPSNSRLKVGLPESVVILGSRSLPGCDNPSYGSLAALPTGDVPYSRYALTLDLGCPAAGASHFSGSAR